VDHPFDSHELLESHSTRAEVPPFVVEAPPTRLLVGADADRGTGPAGNRVKRHLVVVAVGAEVQAADHFESVLPAVRADHEAASGGGRIYHGHGVARDGDTSAPCPRRRPANRLDNEPRSSTIAFGLARTARIEGSCIVMATEGARPW
jgi:hypothetical protein